MSMNFYTKRPDPQWLKAWRPHLASNSDPLAEAVKDLIQDKLSLHIGLATTGWAFQVHVIPELGIMSWADWKVYLYGDGNELPIWDEADKPVRLGELIDWVERPAPIERLDFSEVVAGRATVGPLGLLRQPMGGNVLFHGDCDSRQPWDLITGDFC